MTAIKPPSPSYSHATLDIKESTRLARAMIKDKSAPDASVDERVTNLSNRITVLKQTKQHLEKDVKDITAYYDIGIKGFFRRVIDFFFGSPANKANKEITKIDAELKKTETIKKRLDEVKATIRGKTGELIAYNLQRQQIHQGKGIATPDITQGRLGDLRSAMNAISNPIEYFKKRGELEAERDRLVGALNQNMGMQDELKKLTKEITAKTAVGNILGMVSDDIKARNARIQELENENLPAKIKRFEGLVRENQEALRTHNEPLPERYKELDNKNLLDLLPRFEEAKQMQKEQLDADLEYQQIKLNHGLAESDLRKLESERDDLINQIA